MTCRVAALDDVTETRRVLIAEPGEPSSASEVIVAHELSLAAVASSGLVSGF